MATVEDRTNQNQISDKTNTDLLQLTMVQQIRARVIYIPTGPRAVTMRKLFLEHKNARDYMDARLAHICSCNELSSEDDVEAIASDSVKNIAS